ncbi:photosystem I biogenesis protein BtpA-like [Oratosquilla oratoria]|uniref:photosystem I biogenesis protein BtpA-like n=1 Tax=Oratosquilla oratoria TaxID=337810 RepID=UPI003F7726C9
MALARFQQMFGCFKMAVIGMVHVRALPGTPRSHHSIQELIDLASQEAELYAAAGVDGILVENKYDIPYLQGAELGPEVTATMARVCSAVKQIIPSSLPCGVQFHRERGPLVPELLEVPLELEERAGYFVEKEGLRDDNLLQENILFGPELRGS